MSEEPLYAATAVVRFGAQCPEPGHFRNPDGNMANFNRKKFFLSRFVAAARCFTVHAPECERYGAQNGSVWNPDVIMATFNRW